MLILLAKFLENHPDATQDREVLMLHEGISKKDRECTINTIKTSNKFIALMTYGLESTGHNFQNADHVLFVDRHWNLQVHN